MEDSFGELRRTHFVQAKATTRWSTTRSCAKSFNGDVCWHRVGNNDVFVMTVGGIVKGNTITRRSLEDQLKYDNWSELRRVPQSREPGEVRVGLPVIAGP